MLKSLVFSLAIAGLASQVQAGEKVRVDREQSIKVLDAAILDLNRMQGHVEGIRDHKYRHLSKDLGHVVRDLARLRDQLRAAKVVKPRHKGCSIDDPAPQGTQVAIRTGRGALVISNGPGMQQGGPPPMFNPPQRDPGDMRRPLGKKRWANLKRAIKAEGFAEGKLRVLDSATQDSYFLVGQVKQLLKLFSFGDDKLQALEIVTPRILDRENSFQLYKSFSFAGERDRAKAILER